MHKVHNRPHKNTKGFTLIELLVVIAIIGLLSSVVFASLNSARGKARDAKRLSDIRQLERALEFYYDDNGVYPPHTGSGVVTTSLTELVPTYISALPEDPTRTGTSGYRYWRSPSTAYTMLVNFETDSNASWCGISGGGGVSSWVNASWYRVIGSPDCS